VKTTKPTSDAECPLNVAWAHRIEDLINERAGTRDLNDSEFEPLEISSNDNEKPAPKVTARVVHDTQAP
jgi:hypothetical protein